MSERVIEIRTIDGMRFVNATALDDAEKRLAEVEQALAVSMDRIEEICRAVPMWTAPREKLARVVATNRLLLLGGAK